MKEIPTYVITQDSKGIFERINKSKELSGEFLEACNTYFESIREAIDGALPCVTVEQYQETEIQKQLTSETRQELQKNPTVYCICLDRYLLGDIENEFPDRFFRFSITRTTQGKKVPRPGDRPFPQQIQDFVQKNPSYREKKAIIVDDGVFSGGTIRDTIGIFSSMGVELQIRSVIGFIGEDKEPSPQKRIIRPFTNLYDWVDIRDFSPLGGKTQKTSRNYQVATAIPYLFPWSYGEDASFNSSPNLFILSTRMIQEFQTLVRQFESTEYGKPLFFRDLIKSGFPLPIPSVNTPISVSINTRVADYLTQCIEYIAYEQQRPVCIFDMDGTLYQLDGKNNEYSGSTLELTVRNNALSFIMKKEQCSPEEATKIYTLGTSDPVGVSQFLSLRYGITRLDYFTTVWNIDPLPTIKEYQIPVTTIQALKTNPANKLILLTSAPSPWASRVLQALGLENTFELVFTGEQFGTKDEIFERLAGWYNPKNIISIGDQIKTDIDPAKKYGLQTLLVSSPSDTSQLLPIL